MLQNTLNCPNQQWHIYIFICLSIYTYIIINLQSVNFTKYSGTVVPEFNSSHNSGENGHAHVHARKMAMVVLVTC